MSAKTALPLVLSLIALAAPATAQQKITTQGVTPTEVRIGVHVDQSGPLTSLGIPQRNGHIMRIEEQNAKGGVQGRKINLIMEDNAYDPKKGVLLTQKMIQQDKVFALVGILGTPLLVSSMSMALEEGIPFVFPGSAHRATFEPFNPLKFGMAAPYVEQTRAGVKYFAETIGHKKIGIIYQDDDYGKDIRDGAAAQAKDSKAEVVAQESYKRGETSFSSQVANVRRAGADFVVLGTVPRETAGVMAEMAKVGWKVDALGTSGACSEQVAELGKQAVEGLYLQCQYPPFSAVNQTPAVKDWIARYKARFGIEPDASATITYAMEDMVIIALDRAGRDLTAEKFIKALESIKGYTDIFDSPKQTISAEQHLGTKGFVLARIEGGVFKRVAVLGDQ